MAITKQEEKQVLKAFGDLKAFRKTATPSTQEGFWTKYGVTQSGGSRYESGRNMDKPLKALMALHVSGKIDDATLASAMKIAGQ